MRPLLGSLAIGGLLLGCSRQDVNASAPDVAILQAPSHPGLLLRMQSAPTQTRFSGERQIWMRNGSDAAERVLAYSETVYADGLGGFTIEPGTVTQPQLSSGQRDVFEILQRAREGFLFRYRDFTIRDADLLTQNYTVQDTGTTVSVAGRNCTELRFDRQLAPRRSYVVAVDQVTCLVLRIEELDASNLPTMRMEFTSFDPAPDLTGLTMHQDLAATPIDPSSDTRLTLGFALRLPQVLHGFQFVDAESVDYDGRTWARVHYHDGVEPLLYLYSSRVALPGGSLPAADDDLSKAQLVRVFTAGAWTIIQCKRGGNEFILAGKLDEPRLLETLRSAVE